MKTYLHIVEDHSGSMQTIARAAARDRNATILATQRAAAANNIETLVSITHCGGGIRRVLTNVPIGSVQLMNENAYDTGGGTPLFRSGQQAIDDLLSVPDRDDPEVTFILLLGTDGADTDGGDGGKRFAARVKELQKTDRWTVAFRVPRGDARDLARLGIDPGNILEWDQSERGMAAASQANDAAIDEFYKNRASGVKSSKTFYTTAANLTEAEVKAALGDISASVSLWPVTTTDDGKQIRSFVEARLNGAPMLKGAAFYQLVKTEDKVQDYKLIAIRDKDSGQIYCGPEARDMIGLPRYGDARVRPDTAGKWQVFVQSTSVNRKVNAGTSLMYWPDVGKRFTEGVSAR